MATHKQKSSAHCRAFPWQPSHLRAGLPVLLGLLLALAGCGSGSGASVRENPNPAGPEDTTFTYTGSVQAQTEDVLTFQREVWVNLAMPERCGGCHNAGGQTPLFVRGDDINLAYAAAVDLVDLSTPAQSRLVTKVGEGHNCWLGSAQACADIITGYIAAWADVSGAEATPLVFEAPEDREVGNSRIFPANHGDTTFASTVYPLLAEYCSSCHSESVAARQQPFLGSNDLNIAYDAARSRMRLDLPAASRLVRRLADDSHSCWNNDCAASAAEMQAAIASLAQSIPETQVDPELNVSRALRLVDGIVATEGGRIDSHVVARYEFKTGEGAIAYDTSGVLDINLNLTGDVTWMGSWGLRFNSAGGNNGKAQASTSASQRLFQRLNTAGEYSIEAWVIPDNVVQGDGGMNTSRIISYSGSGQARNFTLGQSMYNYDFLNRSSETSANGLPALSTADADQRLQATLQHVVATFDPVNGRRIYVNGEFTGDEDPLVGAGLAEWDNTFALVLGNEVSSNMPWRGSIRFMAIHDRALSAAAINANYEVGVGARFYLLFNISHLIVSGELTEANNPGAYIAFEVQQFDDYGYLFNQPFLIALNDVDFSGIPLQGLRIGMNGSELLVGQAYVNLDTELSTALFVEGRQMLSPLGTVVEAKQGAENDEFFLTFDRIGSHTYVRVEAEPPQPPPPADLDTQPRVGLRNFGEIGASLSVMTGVPQTTSSVVSTYNNVRQQLPILADLDGFLAAHQMGVTQLAVSYCSALVDNAGWRTSYFPDFDFNRTVAVAFAEQDERDKIIDPLVARMLAGEIGDSRLPSMPDAGEIEAELNSLITLMTNCTGNCDPAERTLITVKAVCAAAVGSAVMLLH